MNGCEFAAGVVAEGIIHRLAVAGGAAAERATERIIGVGTLCHEGTAAVVGHAGKQVALRLIALRQAHTIRLSEHHTIHRVAAGEGGDNSCCVLLRERKAIHRHRLGSDGTGGRRTVLHSFRMFTILRPLGGSQAAFADKNRFRLQRARKLRDELYCTLAFICSLAT